MNQAALFFTETNFPQNYIFLYINQILYNVFLRFYKNKKYQNVHIMSIKNQFLILLIFCVSTIYAQKDYYKKVFFKGEIYFDSGKSELKSESFAILDSAVFYLKKDTLKTLFLTANTDAQGAAAENQALSLRRSQSTILYFIEKGIKKNKITSLELGENDPTASNNDEIGRQKNRRVTIEVGKKVPLVSIRGTVKDSTGPVADAWVYLRSQAYQDSTKTDTEGNYELHAIDKTMANISVIAKDHFFENRSLKIEVAKLKPLEFKLIQPQVGQMVELKNVYFVGSLPTVLPQSIPALKDLALFMQFNPSYKIEIAGHINWPNLPKVLRNSEQFKLSEDRSKTVYEYLVNHGIASERLTPVGYGNWFMRFPYAKSDAQQAANRRVEIKVLGK